VRIIDKIKGLIELAQVTILSVERIDCYTRASEREDLIHCVIYSSGRNPLSTSISFSPAGRDQYLSEYVLSEALSREQQQVLELRFVIY